MTHDYRVFEIKLQQSGHYNAQEIGHGMNWGAGLITCNIEGCWYVLQPTGTHDLSNALRLIEQYEEDSRFALRKSEFNNAAPAA